jgi:hypothetical protein
MHQIQIYKLQDAQRAERLQELTNNDNPTALESEMGAARLLHEEALNRDDPRFALECERVIGQLSHASENAKIRRGELLAKTVVLELAKQIAGILAADVAGRFDGWEEVVNNVKRKSLTLICEAQNPDPD